MAHFFDTAKPVELQPWHQLSLPATLLLLELRQLTITTIQCWSSADATFDESHCSGVPLHKPEAECQSLACSCVEVHRLEHSQLMYTSLSV